MNKNPTMQVLDCLGPAVLNRIGTLYQSWLDRNEHARQHNMEQLAFHQWIVTRDHVDQIRMEVIVAEERFSRRIRELEDKMQAMERRMNDDATCWDDISFDGIEQAGAIVPKTDSEMSALFVAVQKYKSKHKLSLDWLKDFIRTECDATWEDYNVFYYEGKLAVLDIECHDSVRLSALATGRVEFRRGWTSLEAYETDPRRKAVGGWQSDFIPRVPGES
ncbi:FirrV-1-B31 [Feldmannia irregularis virus a]|uniref:FirrV-1-B31 n=1 Tax=Feldmannia irregularis virus a TaxID=231992 RepID=Q6XM05_9PHYC|nr:FirrV-1-B31 [Feldmannia irregularis virus a]AAR26906.1 FirrV-1-B31 [Feldmannia irregularis virus a]